MNDYDSWEEGNIKIPNDQWKAFKTKICDVYNKIVEQDFLIALKIYDAVLEAGKGKRRFNYRKQTILKTTEYNLRADSVSRIENSMFPPDQERKKPLKPKKKNFPIATNRTSFFHLGNATIDISNENKTFGWSVEEGFNAVEEATRHPVALASFNALSEVVWKRNSGGVILSNCTKQETDKISKKYGPLGEKGVLFGTFR